MQESVTASTNHRVCQRIKTRRRCSKQTKQAHNNDKLEAINPGGTGTAETRDDWWVIGVQARCSEPLFTLRGNQRQPFTEGRQAIKIKGYFK